VDHKVNYGKQKYVVCWQLFTTNANVNCVKLSDVCVAWTPDSLAVALAPRHSGGVCLLSAIDGEPQVAVC
jgi:hypothetical protein